MLSMVCCGMLVLLMSFFASTQEFLLRMLVVEFEGVLGVFGVCVRHHSFRFVV